MKKVAINKLSIKTITEKLQKGETFYYDENNSKYDIIDY